MNQAWVEIEDPDDNNPINPDLRQAIYEIAIREGGDEEFDFLKARLEHGPKEQEVINTINGLAASTNLDNLEWYLNQTISEESSIRYQVKCPVHVLGDHSVRRQH